MWKNYIWNPATCICQNGNYLARIMNDSAIISDEIIELWSYNEETKTISTNFIEKNATCKTQNFYI